MRRMSWADQRPRRTAGASRSARSPTSPASRSRRSRASSTAAATSRPRPASSSRRSSGSTATRSTGRPVGSRPAGPASSASRFRGSLRSSSRPSSPARRRPSTSRTCASSCARRSTSTTARSPSSTASCTARPTALCSSSRRRRTRSSRTSLNHGYRFVVVDPLTPLNERIPAVSAANSSGANQAVRHLLDLGHRRIGVLTGPTGWLAPQERLDGYHAALASAGIMPDPALEVASNFQIEGGIEAAGRLLDRPTARRRSSRSTTTWRSARCRPRVPEVCGSRTICPSSASTTSSGPS